MSDLVKELYEPHVAAAHESLKTDPGLRKLVDGSIDAALFERFLLQFAAHGVKMTAPVEGWIRRAGERSVQVGLAEVGKQLIGHAKHEAGHDRMLVEDLHRLTAHWNSRRTPPLRAEALLDEPPYASTRDYVRIHEETITSDLPAGQVAIELEIESLSVVFGGPLIENIARVCGKDVLDRMSFLREHNEIDVGHTALNRRIMERLLQRVPDKAPHLGQIGSEALRIYIRFLNDCLASAEQALRKAPQSAVEAAP